MISRKIVLPKKHSFFLFGPRQTGKSTLIRSVFSKEKMLYFDLLKAKEYHRLSANPALFREEVDTRNQKITHVVVDEIQKLPSLLDEIHSIIESPNPPYFCLSGSSARKLKRAHANLLAGRAWTYHLYPLTHRELGEKFRLQKALAIGTLPIVYLSEEWEARKMLKSYVETYLKEEIEAEAMVRNLGTFLRFLSLAAEENGNLISFSNLSRESGTSYKTIQEYYRILEDTLLGFMLYPYSKSVRRRLVKQPKFYFFDTGVQRAITGKLNAELIPRTTEFGRVFEHFMIAEIIRLNDYGERDYKFSFYRSAAHAEVDLIIRTPRDRVFAVEIKASDAPHVSQLSGLKSFAEICPKAELYCASLAPRKRVVDKINILPWQDIFEALGL